MEFGRVSRADAITYDLPAIDSRPLPSTPSVISDHSVGWSQNLIRIGAPTWSNPVWKGLIYPPHAARGEFLKFYAQTFSTIEMNSTFYAIPRIENLKRWVEQTPGDFKFCPKIPEVISHHLASRDVRPLMLEFLKTIEKLDGRLGPLIFQLPPHFEWNHFPQLKEALLLIPSNIQVAVEFRHPSWFFHNMLVPPVFQFLQNRGVGTLILDVLAHRQIVHTSLTAPFVVVRWMGLNGAPSDSQRLHQWSERLSQLSTRGVKNVYFFVHQESDELVPWSISELGRSLQLKQQRVSRFWQPQDAEDLKQRELNRPGQLSLGGLLDETPHT